MLTGMTDGGRRMEFWKHLSVEQRLSCFSEWWLLSKRFWRHLTYFFIPQWLAVSSLSLQLDPVFNDPLIRQHLCVLSGYSGEGSGKQSHFLFFSFLLFIAQLACQHLTKATDCHDEGGGNPGCLKKVFLWSIMTHLFIDARMKPSTLYANVKKLIKNRWCFSSSTFPHNIYIVFCLVSTCSVLVFTSCLPLCQHYQI